MNDASAVLKPERVILVHGTFASSDADRGDAWWQAGSVPYRELQRRLPPRVQLAGQGEVFHWSGENHERARSRAARSLLEFVQPLEKSGTTYHLIGHSHGGSVVWAALRMATQCGRRLDHLGSWSTVGTPFLHQRSRSPWSTLNLIYAFLSMMLLIPAVKVLWFLAFLPYELAFGRLDEGIVIAGKHQVHAVTAILRSPVLTGLELLGVPVTEVENGIRLGSYDPSSGQSLADFLFGTHEGWLILGAIFLFAYLVLLLLSSCFAPVAEAMRSHWERRLEQKAFERYGGRWLGIWTPDDEAINGLRKTLDISVSFLGNLTQRERVFVSDFLSLPWRPLMQCAAPIYNQLIRPCLDGTIRNLVVKTAQGNNRPATHVVAVSPHPIQAPPTPTAPALPSWLSEKILEAADNRAKDLAPALRKFLGEPLIQAGLERFSKSLSGRELVHTSYFDHPEVLELLALNISCVQPRNRLRRRSTNPRLGKWFEEFKGLQGTLTQEPVEPTPLLREKTKSPDHKQAA